MKNNVIYVDEVFSLEFLVGWQRDWYVFRLSVRLSTNLADVVGHFGFFFENEGL